MTLNGNQLKAVNDAATNSAYNNGFEFKNGANTTIEYTYDANGNLTKDLNKNIIDIQYNFLNLPSMVQFSDGSTISYIYNADGIKLRTVHKIGSTTTTTDYCGNVIYENNTAKLLLTEGGYVSLNDNKYHYYLKDHQGNNRVVVDTNGKVEETNHYYPFGGLFANSTSTQSYKYNGKELDTKKGLNWYDYGARHYDAAVGRWHAIDPMTEKFYLESPYTYCLNNPVKYIDPDGQIVKIANNTVGALENLAKIVATTHGQTVLNRLIQSNSTYKMKSVYFTSSSKYKDQTINYVGDTWYSTIDGGSASNEVIMGHETYHAYQDDTRQISWYKGEIGNVLELERGAVGFENYLRSVYGDGQMRVKYSGLRGGEAGVFNPNFLNEDKESITNFTSLGNNDKKTSFGFSFDKTTSKTNTHKYYTIVSSDNNKNFNYQIYSSEEEYNKATLNW